MSGVRALFPAQPGRSYQGCNAGAEEGQGRRLGDSNVAVKHRAHIDCIVAGQGIRFNQPVPGLKVMGAVPNV